MQVIRSHLPDHIHSWLAIRSGWGGGKKQCFRLILVLVPKEFLIPVNQAEKRRSICYQSKEWAVIFSLRGYFWRCLEPFLTNVGVQSVPQSEVEIIAIGTDNKSAFFSPLETLMLLEQVKFLQK